MQRFANPARFMRISAVLLPWVSGVAVLSLLTGLVWALGFSPPDYQQGETVRLMYIHVPAAWMALGTYSGLAAASAVYLIWKHPLADVAARASAPIGLVFAFVTLATGAIWGKPMWGAWWVWDARLTSMLILFFQYLAYMALIGAFRSEEREKKVLAIYALIGFVNLPIIKFSVEWWNTLHQPASLVRMGGPSIHASMLTPLLIMIAAFTLIYMALLLARMRTLLTEHKIRRLQQRVVWDT